MASTIGISCVAACWLAFTFTLLQLLEQRARWPLLPLLGSMAVGIAVLLAHGPDLGMGWLREQSLRSDAIALGALCATAAVVVGTHVRRLERRSTWGPTTAAVAALGCAIAGTCALALGRGGGHWEFVAIIGGGALLASTGTIAALHRDRTVNARLVFATSGAAGGFLCAGGVLLLLAWRALS